VWEKIDSENFMAVLNREDENSTPIWWVKLQTYGAVQIKVCYYSTVITEIYIKELQEKPKDLVEFGEILELVNETVSKFFNNFIQELPDIRALNQK